MYYTGIGSRKTPAWGRDQMTRIATWLAGAAPGADTAFEQGAVDGTEVQQVFLGWTLFDITVHSGRLATLSLSGLNAMDIFAYAGKCSNFCCGIRDSVNQRSGIKTFGVVE